LSLLLAAGAQAQPTAPLRLTDYAAAHPAATACTQDFSALSDGLPEGWYVNLGAFQLAPGSKDAALVVTLQASKAHTVQVSGVANTTGETLVEIYLLP
jgi:hypothetical protein